MGYLSVIKTMSISSLKIRSEFSRVSSYDQAFLITIPYVT